MSYLRIWRYHVAAGKTAEFEKAYGPAGDWARLFQLAEGYLGTELLRPASPGTDYATIDRWRSVADWQRFLEKHGAAYHELGRRLAPLCAENVGLGNFTC